MQIVTLAVASTLIATLASDVCVESPPSELVHEGTTYRPVSGRELVTALAGHRIVVRDCRLSSLCTDEFGSDGWRFVRSGDRNPFEPGFYWAAWDRYCMIIYPGTLHARGDCKALLRSEDGTVVELWFYRGRWQGAAIVDVIPNRY